MLPLFKPAAMMFIFLPSVLDENIKHFTLSSFTFVTAIFLPFMLCSMRALLGVLEPVLRGYMVFACSNNV